MPLNVSPLRAAENSSPHSGGQTAPLPPDISVVIPIFNEAENIDAAPPTRVEDARRRWVVRTRSGTSTTAVPTARWSCCALIARDDPHVGVIELTRNFGQHAAVLAGFAAARGRHRRHPRRRSAEPARGDPAARGQDRGGLRRRRRLARGPPGSLVSAAPAPTLINRLTVAHRRRDDERLRLHAARLPARASSQQIIDCDERSQLHPGAGQLARASAPPRSRCGTPTAGAARSKYSPAQAHAARRFDLITGFSLLPIQLVSLAGILVALAGIGFGVFLLRAPPVRRPGESRACSRCSRSCSSSSAS